MDEQIQTTSPDQGSTLLQAEREEEKRYKREVWWVEHRLGLRRLGIGCIIALEILFGLIGLFAFVDYFLVDYVDEQRLVESFFVGADNLRDTTIAQVPRELGLSTATAVSAGDEFDLVAFVENANEDWVARMTYRFEYDGQSTPEKTILVLQGSEQVLAEFGLPQPRPRNPQLVVDDLEWFRITSRTTEDPIAWKQERLNMEVEEVRHSNDLAFDAKTVGRTTMVLNNKSGFGYYEVLLSVVLRRGGAIVGVNQTTLSNLQPRESRTVQVDWFDQATNASVVDVYTHVNLFDETAYLPTSAEPNVDPRDQIRQR